MRIKYLLLAKDSSIDRDKNTSSIFDLFEGITIEAAVSKITMMVHVFCLIERKDEKGAIADEALISVISPDGVESTRQEIPFKMKPENLRCRVRTNILLPIGSSGKYVFNLQLKNEVTVQASADIDVDFKMVAPQQISDRGLENAL